MQYNKTTLKNGLRIITAPMKDTQTTTIFVTVGVGSRYEEEEEAGISHFIEHMIFKGTKKRPNTQVIANELDAIGGTFNAFTGKNRTAYYAKVDAKHFDIALNVISDIFLNSKIETKEINREKGTVLQELSMYKDMPMRTVEDDFERLLYGKQKLGREIIGYKKTITDFKRKDFTDYMDRFYIASDTVICVAGKISEQKVIAQLKKYFAKMKKGKKTEIEKVIEKQIVSKIKIKNKKTDQTHLILGVRTYDHRHKDRYALSLLSSILGGNMSSRLHIQVRERQGLAYYIRTDGEAYQDVGYLMVGAGVEHKNLEKTIKIILRELKKISAYKVSEKELQKAKNYIKGKSVMGLEPSDAVASYLADQEVMKNEILIPDQVFKKIDKVTVNDIQRVAKDIFVSKNLNLAVIGPHKEKEDSILKKLKFS